jgi:hypothetical protein
MSRVKNRYHRGSDGWGRDSYEIPGLAVAGASDTGDYEGFNPAPTDKVAAELKRLVDHLKGLGYRAKLGGYTTSGNANMVKRWVVVDMDDDFSRAKAAADKWMAEHKDDTTWIHDAD